MEKIFLTKNEEETFELGERLGRLLTSGDFVALRGDLGAGKTTFTKGIARGMEITDFVTSPTFTIINEYIGDTKLIHIDTYRLNRPEELEDIGFFDYLSEGVIVMEWADKVAKMLPEEALWVYFDILGAQMRRVQFVCGKSNFNEKLEEMSER